MMLVSSSGWAQMPRTSSLTGLSSEFVGGAVVPFAASRTAATPAAARISPKRLTSLLPECAGNRTTLALAAPRVKQAPGRYLPCRPTAASTLGRWSSGASTTCRRTSSRSSATSRSSSGGPARTSSTSASATPTSPPRTSPSRSSPRPRTTRATTATRPRRGSRTSGSRAPTLYRRRFGVELDHETQVLNTIGAKEGLSHLMWVLLEPGDSALVPSPSYPIHIHGPILAGAAVTRVPMGPDEEDLFANLEEAWERAQPKPRVLILSFPHNPTTATVDLEFMERVVAFARRHGILVVHDFAYADLAFDGYEPPSILQVPGADGRRGRAVHADEVVLDGGLARRLRRRQRGGRRRPRAPQVLARLRHLPADPDRRDRRDERAAGLPARGVGRLPVAPRHALRRARAGRAGCSRSRRGRCSCGRRSRSSSGSSARSRSPRSWRGRRASRSRPGIGFGADGEGFVRFALVENEHRIGQAVRGIRRLLERSPEPTGVSGP